MRASIHLITKDRCDSLALLMESLRKQTYKEFDLVILDGSDGQKISEHQPCQFIIQRMMLEGHRVSYQFVSADQTKRDIGAARNACIDQDPWKKNPIIIRIDDDSICEPDYIEKLMKGFDLGDDVGIVGGTVPYYWMEKMYRPVPETWNAISEFFVNPGEQAWNDDCIFFYRDADRYFPSGHIRSSFAIRREIIEKLRFEDWTGSTGFTEETVTCVKVQILGYRVLINPTAVCWHLNLSSGAGRASSDYKDPNFKQRNLLKVQKILHEFRTEHNAPIKSYP